MGHSTDANLLAVNVYRACKIIMLFNIVISDVSFLRDGNETKFLIQLLYNNKECT